MKKKRNKKDNVVENKVSEEKKEEVVEPKKKGNTLNNVFTIILSICDVIAITVLFLLYGPYSSFRDFLVTTAMSTMRHQYLAMVFYSDDVIKQVLENNVTIEPDFNTDTSLIVREERSEYLDEYDKEILDRPKDLLYKVIEIKEKGFSGYMAVIYDPSKIKVVTSKYLGTTGEYLVDMANREGAVVAINGGGFADAGGLGNGGQPSGTIIQDGKILNYGGGVYNRGLIGFTNDNKLYLGKISATEAINLGIRDAVEFGPFLIVNGSSSFINGNGGYGYQPRSAIAQRKDGIVLFLVIDGRSLASRGADMNELVDILLRYHAYNAANLDGGNSSVLVIDGTIINHPFNWDNLEVTRPIPDGFIVVE